MKSDKKYWIILGVIVAFLIILLPSRKPRKLIKPKKIITKEITGRIAIVLDDWGYNLENVDALMDIKQPITLAILPNLPFSRKISEDSHKAGLEIILHLPMQPKGNYKLEKNTIVTLMNKQEIETIISNDLLSVIYAKGVSNHMGSAVTADPAALKLIFNYLKKRGLFFLDSYVASDSVCDKVARSTRIRFAKRDLFLDNSSNPDHIRRQLYSLKRVAKSKGHAIGIGHDRRNTLMVLKELLPEFEKEGYKFVFLSELIK